MIGFCYIFKKKSSVLKPPKIGKKLHMIVKKRTSFGRDVMASGGFAVIPDKRFWPTKDGSSGYSGNDRPGCPADLTP